MDIQKIIDELRAERLQIEEAILSLERLSATHGKRRGRPPKWLTEVRATADGDHRPVPKRAGAGRKTKATVKRRNNPRPTAAMAPAMDADGQG